LGPLKDATRLAGDQDWTPEDAQGVAMTSDTPRLFLRIYFL